MKISEVQEIFENTDIENIDGVIDEFSQDERTGVQKLIVKYRRKKEADSQERMRLEQLTAYERIHEDKQYICGIDEAGRGPLCGPVVAAGVILPKDALIYHINDSKKLSGKMREQLYAEIMEKAIAVGTGIVSPQVIDEINILQATYEAMRIAIRQLSIKPDFLLIDAVQIPGVDIPQTGIIKGDGKSVSIAAASIIAKVTRDRMMLEYDKLYPEYGFARNKGYGSKEHIEVLRKIGPCPIHRETFIKNFSQ